MRRRLEQHTYTIQATGKGLLAKREPYIDSNLTRVDQQQECARVKSYSKRDNGFEKGRPRNSKTHKTKTTEDRI